MVPAINSSGRTFKAAASYILHDRLPEGGQAETAHRVAWTETLNLPTTDPERAWRIMADTASPLAQAELKAAAGIRATGRKLERPCFGFSLSWHPDERPTKADQLAAVHEALAALGLAEHQTLITAHSDTGHPHVHVLVNRVHPQTGRAAPLAKSKLVLSEWAQSYEERHGRVRCQARVENNARRNGVRPGRAADNRRRRAHRAEHAAGPDDAATLALKAAHAAAFGAQAAREHHGARRRRAELHGFTQAQRAERRANRAQAAPPVLDAAQAETHARLSGLLASSQPAAALAALTRERSTFTRPELERFVARHTPDQAAFQTAMAAIDLSPDVIRVGRDGRGRIRFTTAGHQAIERRMFDLAATMHRDSREPVPARFKGWSLSGDQEAALLHVLGPARLAAVSGVAGSGKSTMLHAARQSWTAAGLQVQGLALAAEAAEGLAQGSGITSTTLHKRLYLWEQGRNLPGPKDVVVVDEAGMIGSRQIERLLHFCQQGGAKLVLVGDARQLQAIEAGGAFRAITDRIGAAVMTRVRRQKQDWQRAATNELATGRTPAALARYEAADCLHEHATDAAARRVVIDAWHAQRAARPAQTQLMLAYLRRDVAALNALARARLHRDGALGADVELATATGRQSFAVHDRIAFTRNNGKLGVRNGSLGTIEAIEGGRVTVRLDGAKPVRLTFSPAEYGHFVHGYASTIHKSQGATVDRAHLFCSRNLDQHAAYVAMTRHRDRLDVHWSRESIGSRARLTVILSRLALKDTSYDYADEATEQAAARRDAAAETAARIKARARTFRERERTGSGREQNARSLLLHDVSALALWRLARDAGERSRLFRQQQQRLRQWLRRTVPPETAATPPPAPPDRAQARLDQATAGLAAFAALSARHQAERQADAAARRALQREAAQAWRQLAATVASGQAATPYGYPDAFWTAAAHPPAMNDNDPDSPPPRRGPRPA